MRPLGPAQGDGPGEEDVVGNPKELVKFCIDTLLPSREGTAIAKGPSCEQQVLARG